MNAVAVLLKQRLAWEPVLAVQKTVITQAVRHCIDSFDCV